MSIDLHYRFFEFAEDNIKVAKFLQRNGYYLQSIYQFCQSFEKIMKSYYIFVKTKMEHNNADEIY